jgi:hypothetical protein
MATVALVAQPIIHSKALCSQHHHTYSMQPPSSTPVALQHTLWQYTQPLPSTQYTQPLPSTQYSTHSSNVNRHRHPHPHRLRHMHKLRGWLQVRHSQHQPPAQPPPPHVQPRLPPGRSGHMTPQPACPRPSRCHPTGQAGHCPRANHTSAGQLNAPDVIVFNGPAIRLIPRGMQRTTRGHGMHSILLRHAHHTQDMT